MDHVLKVQSVNALPGILKGYGKIFVLLDRNMDRLHGKTFREIFHETGCHTGIQPKIFLLDASENRKTLNTVSEILSWLLEQEAGRDAFLLGIGGGITTDLTGFTASIYKRGIRFGLVPTTLLAQCDASLGGKTGVNHDRIKNAAGTFSDPEFILTDPSLLDTLPPRELRSGLAELLKTFLIASRTDFIAFRTPADKTDLSPFISRAASIKLEIVEKDRFDHGERAKLNLGHTIGHALEACCHGQIAHGEAVAAGLLCTAEFSRKKGRLEDQEARLIREVLQTSGFSTAHALMEKYSGLPPELFGEKLVHFIRNDKKRKEDFINFVYIRSIGNVLVERTDLSTLKISEDDLR